MSRDDARRTLVAYDIPDDGRRKRLSKLLQSFGDRVQYSVFVVDCSPARMLRLRQKVQLLIDPRVDSVLYCDLGPVASLTREVFSWDGSARAVTPQETIVV